MPLIRYFNASSKIAEQLHSGSRTKLCCPIGKATRVPEKGEVIVFTEPVKMIEDWVKTPFLYLNDNTMLIPFHSQPISRLNYETSEPPLWSARLIFECSSFKTMPVSNLTEEDCKSLGVEKVYNDGQFYGYRNYLFDETNPSGYANLATAVESYQSFWNNEFKDEPSINFESNPTIYLIKLKPIKNKKIVEIIQQYIYFSQNSDEIIEN